MCVFRMALATMIIVSQAGRELQRTRSRADDDRAFLKHVSRRSLSVMRLRQSLLARPPKEVYGGLSSLLLAVQSTLSRHHLLSVARRSSRTPEGQMWWKFWKQSEQEVPEVKILRPIAAGNYGKIFSAQFSHERNGSREVVAKIAEAKVPTESSLAKRFLESEATIHASVLGLPGISTFLGSAKTSEGVSCVVFERIRPLDGSDGPPTSLADFLGKNHNRLPISPVEVLRQLLNTLASLHEASYIHRDVKLENLLLKSAPIEDGTNSFQNKNKNKNKDENARELSVELIDFGAAVSVDNCEPLGRMMDKCSLDGQNHPCTMLYLAPERYAHPDYPFALDIYAAGLCFLRLVWGDVLGTDESFSEFRAQLAASGGDLEVWLRTRLQATVMPEAFLDALYRFPAGDSEAFAAVRSMLNTDFSKRPSAEALLARSFLSPTAKQRRTDSHDMNYESLVELLLEDCKVPQYDVVQRPLAVRVRLSLPYGLEMDEGESGGLVITKILTEGSGFACGQLRVGDRLSSVGETSVRGMSFDQAVATISSVHEAVGPEVELLFERSCSDEDECELPEDVMGGEAAEDSTIEQNASIGMDSRFVSPAVQDSGAFSIIGGRSRMEDTYVLTSFNVAGTDNPRSFVLGAVFDGHRGDAASTHAAEIFPPAVSAAIAKAEPSPLAVGWRHVVDTYLQSGKQDGSTASAVLLSDSGVAEFLNCGDSRVVVGSTSAKVLYATRDHAAGAPSEVDRIRRSGGSVECTVGGDFRVAVDAPTLDGVILVAVARALGGSEWVGGQISNAADVTTFHLPPDAATIIVATDGIWGVMDGSEVVKFIHDLRKTGLTAGEAAQRLIFSARDRGSRDNCAALVLYKS